MILNPNIPTIITGDWNTRHPDWDDSIDHPSPRAQETLEWVEGNGFTLCNKPFIPTQEDHVGHAMVIDLTFKNAIADASNLLSGHQVNTSIGALSDHHTLIFKIGDPEKVVYNTATYNLNWKHAVEKTFMEQLENQLEVEKDTYETLVSEVLNAEKVLATPEKLDRAADTIQNTLLQAAHKAVLERTICDKSKPWWTPELSTAYSQLRETKEIL